MCQLITLTQASKLGFLKHATLALDVRSGALPSFLYERRRFIDLDDLESYCDRRRPEEWELMLRQVDKRIAHLSLGQMEELSKRIDDYRQRRIDTLAAYVEENRRTGLAPSADELKDLETKSL